MKTSTFVKTLLTVTVVILGGLVAMISLSIAATSHTISESTRENSTTRFMMTPGITVLLIVLIWLPWKRIFKKE